MTLKDKQSHSFRKNIFYFYFWQCLGQTDLEHDLIVKRSPGTYHVFCAPCDGLVVNPVLPYAPLSRLPAHIQSADRGVRDLKVPHTAQRYYGNTEKSIQCVNNDLIYVIYILFENVAGWPTGPVNAVKSRVGHVHVFPWPEMSLTSPFA